jgi:Ftsk gamma domain
MGFARRVVRKSVHKATPRPLRKAMHPARTVKNAVTPRPVKQASRAAYTVRHPVGAAENKVIGVALNGGRSPRRKRRGGLLGFLFGGRAGNAGKLPVRQDEPQTPDAHPDPPQPVLRVPGTRTARDEQQELTRQARDLLVQSADLVVTTQFGSASMVQSRLNVSSSEAALLIDLLDMHGIVGPADGSGARAVLIGADDLPWVLASLHQSPLARVRRRSPRADPRPGSAVPTDYPAGESERQARREVGLGHPRDVQQPGADKPHA